MHGRTARLPEGLTRREFAAAGACAALAAGLAVVSRTTTAAAQDFTPSAGDPVMTLILGARAPKHAVVLADGFSTRRAPDGSAQVLREDLRKIFPSPAHPYVLAHHGRNTLGDLPVAGLLEDLLRTELDPAWPRGLNFTAARLVEALDSVVSQALKVSREKTVFGLWLAGRWPCTPVAEIVEVLWAADGGERARVSVMPHGNLVMGGSGAEHLKEYVRKPLDDRFDGGRIWNESTEYAVDFLRALYRRALERQAAAGARQFGGQVRLAVITETGVQMRDL